MSNEENNEAGDNSALAARYKDFYDSRLDVLCSEILNHLFLKEKDDFEEGLWILYYVTKLPNAREMFSTNRSAVAYILSFHYRGREILLEDAEFTVKHNLDGPFDRIFIQDNQILELYTQVSEQLRTRISSSATITYSSLFTRTRKSIEFIISNPQLFIKLNNVKFNTESEIINSLLRHHLDTAIQEILELRQKSEEGLMNLLAAENRFLPHVIVREIVQFLTAKDRHRLHYF